MHMLSLCWKNWDILKLQQLKFYFKYSHNKLPTYFSKPVNGSSPVSEDIFDLKLNSNIHNSNTRHKHKLHISHKNRSYVEKCLRHNIVDTINSTPNSILMKVHTHSLLGFTDPTPLHSELAKTSNLINEYNLDSYSFVNLVSSCICLPEVCYTYYCVYP